MQNLYSTPLGFFSPAVVARSSSFLNQQNPVASALMAKMQIAPSDRPKVKAECLRLLVTLRLDPARMQLISGFIDSYLDLTESEEQVFQAELGRIEPESREEVMQIVTSWMRTGIQLRTCIYDDAYAQA